MRDIPGLEGRYAATEDGFIWSYNSNKFLKGRKAAHGYLKVRLCGKEEYIHRLVAKTYIPNPNH